MELSYFIRRILFLCNKMPHDKWKNQSNISDLDSTSFKGLVSNSRSIPLSSSFYVNWTVFFFVLLIQGASSFLSTDLAFNYSNINSAESGRSREGLINSGKGILGLTKIRIFY